MTNENALVQVYGGRSFSAGNLDWMEVEFGEFQAISDRANRLLSREGDFDVAFKKSISGLESDGKHSCCSALYSGRTSMVRELRALLDPASRSNNGGVTNEPESENSKGDQQY